MDSGVTRSIILLVMCIILCGCSQRITDPKETTWKAVPCDYRLEGEDESLLMVRAEVADFDSAKIVLHSLSWTVFGDTLARQTILFPDRCTRSVDHVTFACDRPLPMNSVVRGVDLFVKNCETASLPPGPGYHP